MQNGIQDVALYGLVHHPEKLEFFLQRVGHVRGFPVERVERLGALSDLCGQAFDVGALHLVIDRAVGVVGGFPLLIRSLSDQQPVHEFVERQVIEDIRFVPVPLQEHHDGQFYRLHGIGEDALAGQYLGDVEHRARIVEDDHARANRFELLARQASEVGASGSGAGAPIRGKDVLDHIGDDGLEGVQGLRGGIGDILALRSQDLKGAEREVFRQIGAQVIDFLRGVGVGLKGSLQVQVLQAKLDGLIVERHAAQLCFRVPGMVFDPAVDLVAAGR